jgi:hypothetical protein
MKPSFARIDPVTATVLRLRRDHYRAGFAYARNICQARDGCTADHSEEQVAGAVGTKESTIRSVNAA